MYCFHSFFFCGVPFSALSLLLSFAVTLFSLMARLLAFFAHRILLHNLFHLVLFLIVCNLSFAFGLLHSLFASLFFLCMGAEGVRIFGLTMEINKIYDIITFPCGLRQQRPNRATMTHTHTHSHTEHSISFDFCNISSKTKIGFTFIGYTQKR